MSPDLVNDITPSPLVSACKQRNNHNEGKLGGKEFSLAIEHKAKTIILRKLGTTQMRMEFFRHLLFFYPIFLLFLLAIQHL